MSISCMRPPTTLAKRGLLTRRSVTKPPMVVPNVPKSTESVPDIETNWI
jgi:hypothetical protein